MSEQSSPITVRDIIQTYLTEHGYDGLANEGCGCGGDIDDLFACGWSGGRCTPAYRWHGPEGCPIGESKAGCKWADQPCECYRPERQP